MIRGKWIAVMWRVQGAEGGWARSSRRWAKMNGFVRKCGW